MDSAEAVAVEEASADAAATEVAVVVEEALVADAVVSEEAVEVSYQIFESNVSYPRLPARPTRKS